MPQCNKCGAKFPNVIKVDGKQKYLNKRKYCLNCSPLGVHNTRQIHLPMDGLVCKTCGRLFEYKVHYTSREQCYSCKVNHRRFERKKKAVEYKGGSCIVCGYNRCIHGLTFHHLDPDKKEFQISGNHCLSWEKVVEELDKCVLLCNRCHVEVHSGMIDGCKLTASKPTYNRS